MQDELIKLEADVATLQPAINELSEIFHNAVIGQQSVFRSILICMMNEGHMLLEGVPGIAKTLMASTFAQMLTLDFKRVQFTPDLIPGDITGTQIFNSQKDEFIHRHGPVFTNILLADEINRAPAKVQSALLEAMQERQVTIGDATYPIARPFLVIATQNPIEQEGTYNLPEAQLDRFMFKTLVGYPSRAEEEQIIEKYEKTDEIKIRKIKKPGLLRKLSRLSKEIFVDSKLKDYILDIVLATRRQNDAGSGISSYLRLGASPRASLYLLRASKSLALLSGRGFIIPEDIQTTAFEILRHRLILSFDALADGMTPDDIVSLLLEKTVVP
ncbi:MoxR family ATPase [bacterium]|nr:MoxR family ATPase [bacterium]